MTEHGDKDARGARLTSVRTMDVVVALLFLGASAVVIGDSLRVGIGWDAIEGPRAGYFPFRIGVIMAIASAVNLARAVADRSGGDRTFVTWPAFRKVLTVLVPLVVYAGFVHLVGIYFPSAIYIALFVLLFGQGRWLRRLIVGVLSGLSVAFFFFLMFEIWFLTPLPSGQVEEAMRPIVQSWLRGTEAAVEEGVAAVGGARRLVRYAAILAAALIAGWVARRTILRARRR